MTFPLECSPLGYPAGSFPHEVVAVSGDSEERGSGVRLKLICKSPRELEIMRSAGKIVWLTLNELEAATRPGISTGELDALAERVIRSHGAIPSFKGYRKYPAAIC